MIHIRVKYGSDAKYGKNAAMHIDIIFLIWHCGDSL